MSIASNALQKVIQIVLRKIKTAYWEQIIKLGTKHVIHLKLASFTSNKDVCVNRLERVFFRM